MGLIQRALKLLQEFPNLKNEPFRVKDKKKKSFLEEAEKFFKKLTSSEKAQEVEPATDDAAQIDLDQIPDDGQVVSTPIIPLESDEEDGLIVDLDSIEELEEAPTSTNETSKISQKHVKDMSEESEYQYDPSLLEDESLTKDLLESEKILKGDDLDSSSSQQEETVSFEVDEEEGIVVDLDAEDNDILPSTLDETGDLSQEEAKDVSEESDYQYNPSLLENESLTKDLLESEKILNESNLDSSSIPDEDITPLEINEDDGIVVDLDSTEETNDLPTNLNEGSSGLDENVVEEPEFKYDSSILEDEAFTQDLLESEKILNEEIPDEELVEVKSLEDFDNIKPDSIDEFSGDSETISLGDDLLSSEINLDEISEDNEELDLIDESNILEDWEKDVMAESDSVSSDKEKSAKILDDLEEDVLPLEDSVVGVNAVDAFETAKQFKSSYEEKLEGYLVLFEITKELLKSTSFDDFFENLMYSIIGQVGPEIMIIFSSRDGNFSQMKIVAYEGIDIEPDYVIKKGDTLYSLLESEYNVVYARDLLSNDLKERERILLENPLTEILIPIRVMDQFSGFIVAGKMISGEEYTEKDFEFLQILVEVSGNFLSKLFDYESLSSEISELNKIINSTSSITDFTNKVYTCKTLDELYDVISEDFLKEFKLSSFTFMILDTKDWDYKVFGSNYLLPETLDKFQLSKDSKIITMISQVSDIYRLENYQTSGELISNISKEELEGMNEFTIIPLINIGRLVGLFIIHKLATEWSPGFKRTILSLTNIIAPIVANLVMQSEKESLFRNPFNPLQETIDREIKYCESKNKQFTLIILKILNVTRILNILGINFFSEYSEFISKKIFENTKPSDYVSRIGQGKFAILLKENTKADSESFISKIKSEIVLFHNPSRDFKLSIQIYSLTYPEQTKEKRKFIEMMEET